MCPKVGAAGHMGHTATHAQRRDQITMMCPKVVAVGHKGLKWETWDNGHIVLQTMEI